MMAIDDTGSQITTLWISGGTVDYNSGVSDWEHPPYVHPSDPAPAIRDDAAQDIIWGWVRRGWVTQAVRPKHCAFCGDISGGIMDLQPSRLQRYCTLRCWFRAWLHRRRHGQAPKSLVAVRDRAPH